MASPENKIGFWGGTALVVGNMVGSGVFLLPASLAVFGSISILGWVFSSIGAVFFAVVFGQLGKYAPQTIGGPYVYTRMGFGDFPAFLVAWGYWISIWCTNAAIAVAIVGYLEVFLPFLKGNALAASFTALFFIWFFSWINLKQLQTIAFVQVLTTILKVIPILLVGLIGIFYFKIENIGAFNISGTSDFAAITTTTMLTLFAYLGMESATIPSKKIKDPEKNVRRATVVGTVFTIFLYLISFVAILGLVPPAELMQSNAPFADAASRFWGEPAKYIIAAGAIIATMGALNGWILMQGQIPFAIAEDKLFPSFFGRENKNGAPYLSIILSSVLASILILFNFSSTLVEAYSFMITLSTLSVLLPFLMSAATLVLLLKGEGKSVFHRNILISVGAILFAVWIMIGCGLEVIGLGFLLLVVGVPVYFLRKRYSNE